MKPAPLPENEQERLASLARTRLLDSVTEVTFDDFARIAAEIAGTPIALVTLIDEHRQWFKARVGIAATETPRDQAFCAHAILEDGLFEVPDARADERFHDNPLVVGEPYVRFYAGAPIEGDGKQKLGTVCVVDHVARTLTPPQREALTSLSRLISAHIELRRKSLELAELHREAVENAARLRLNTELLDLANDMILVKDFAGHILYWNQGAERAYGYTRDEALGQIAHDLLRTTYSGSRQAVVEILERDGYWEGELVRAKKDGAQLIVGSRWVLQRDDKGAPRAILELSSDITRRKEVQRMKDEFVSIVSHELRTPLTSIRGALGLLEGGVVGELPGEALELVKIARSNSDRLIRLVNDILDLEKMEAGKLELDPREISARAVIDGVVRALETLAQQAELRVRVEAPPELRLVADEDRVTQLLTNLVSNAIKFSPPNTTVTVSAERRGPRTVRLAVRDQGPGIPPDQLGKLFGKFQQVDASDQRRRGGTGLGLSISKAIAEQHGGAIGVETLPGKGALFWADLPAKAVSTMRSVAHGPRRLVLLVDARGTLSQALSPLLAEEGCVVARASDLAEAERWLDNSHPAAVIVDVDLPDSHALDIVEALSRRFTPDESPTIVLTGRLPDDDRRAAPLPVEWVLDPLDDQSIKHALRWGRRKGGVPRVLLIEDDAGFRTVMAARLRTLGVEVLEAGDAESALEAVRTTAPDLIVLDIGLPGRDGFDVVAELRQERARSTPLIVYTARDLGHEERVELSLGITRWLTKSRTDEEHFVQAVRELLSGLLPSTQP